MTESTKILVDEFTTPSPVSVLEDKPIVEILEIMEHHQFRHVPVVSKSGEPVGILSDRDAKTISGFDIMKKLKAKDVMTTEPYIANSNTLLEDVALEMSRNKWGSAIISYPEENSFGIFTSTDALNALVELLREKRQSRENENASGL